MNGGSRTSIKAVASSVVASLLAMLQATVATPQKELGNSASEFITKKASAGKVADFEGREITGKELEELLERSDTQVAPRGLRISEAVVTSRLNLVNADIPYQVEFESCDFVDGVNISQSRFRKSLRFKKCRIKDTADLQGILVDEHLDLSESRFFKTVDLDFTRVQGQLTGSGSVFQDRVSGREMKIGLSANFCGVSFKPVALNTNFVPTKEMVAHALAHVGESGTTEKVELRQIKEYPKDDTTPVPEFKWLLIVGGSYPDHYQIWQRCYGTTNYSLELEKQTIFAGPVDLRGTSVGGQLLAEGVLFGSQVQFDGMKAAANLDFKDATFGGGASFGYVNVADEFTANQAQFTNDATVNFYGMKAGVLALRGTEFYGSAMLENVEITHALYADRVRFANSNRMANFYGMKVNGSVFLKEAIFAGPVNFILARVAGNFEATGAQFISQAGLTNLDVITRQRPFSFNTDFGSMTVGGFVVLSHTWFAGMVSFRNASFQHLHLDLAADRADVFGGTNNVRLEGLSYRRIRSITNEVSELSGQQLAQSWENLKEMLRIHTAYSADVYQKLEDYFRNEGQPGIADEVYITGRERERETIFGTFEVGKCFPWFWNWFLDRTVGYGRRPEKALLYSLLVILIGWRVFTPLSMKPKDEANATESKIYSYSSFWFSVDLFLPLIELWDSDVWIPKRDRQWTWRYMRVHRILGWILVPIALAAFSGIIK